MKCWRFCFVVKGELEKMGRASLPFYKLLHICEILTMLSSLEVYKWVKAAMNRYRAGTQKWDTSCKGGNGECKGQLWW